MTLSTFADPVPAARSVASPHADTRVVERFIDAVFVRFDADAAARLITPDFVSHPWAALGAPAGPAGVHAIVPFFRTAFGEVSATVLDRLVDGDRVALRYAYAGRHVGDLFGIPATGRHFRMEGIAILRLEDGRVAEYWREEDMLGLQRQLGVASLLAVTDA
jgi:predicted ester cyclase